MLKSIALLVAYAALATRLMFAIGMPVRRFALSTSTVDVDGRSDAVSNFQIAVVRKARDGRTPIVIGARHHRIALDPIRPAERSRCRSFERKTAAWHTWC